MIGNFAFKVKRTSGAVRTGGESWAYLGAPSTRLTCYRGIHCHRMIGKATVCLGLVRSVGSFGAGEMEQVKEVEARRGWIDRLDTQGSAFLFF